MCKSFSPTVSTKPARITYAVILGGALLWCAAILAAPALEGSPWSFLSHVIYRFFQPVCHQLDGRSFHLFGHPFAACIRCSSIYFTFLGGTLLYPFVRHLQYPVVPPRTFLILGLLPMILDVAAGAAGIHEITWQTRTVTGAIAGFTLSFFVLPAAIEAAVRYSTSRIATSLQKGTSDA